MPTGVLTPSVEAGLQRELNVYEPVEVGLVMQDELRSVRKLAVRMVLSLLIWTGIFYVCGLSGLLSLS